MRLLTLQVVPALPERLAMLKDLVYNLLWSWDEAMRVVFTRLDRELWDSTYQNPVLMLGQISQERLEALARDDSFLALCERTRERLDSYLRETTWWDQRFASRPLIAYFSAEYGIAECLPIYSGGLGVLAGHHLKSASDLGVPLVGVGLLYQQGYFRQYLTADGWQQESYPTNDFYNLPVLPAQASDGSPLRITISLAGTPIAVQVWRAQVGRVPLYLLDTNLPENPPELRDVTDQLYGGDQETRIRQEIVLGMGGLRALHALGLKPAVCHMNEGHSAFLALERIATLMKEQKLSFAEAFEVARSGNIFTTHTAVQAGFDAFAIDLFERHFAEFVEETGIPRETLIKLGRGEPNGPPAFNMAALALRTSAFVNGVSRLHGEVSRRMLSHHVAGVPASDLPIGHVTNGAHLRSCVSREMAELFDRYLGPDWWRRPGQAEVWKGVDDIPDEELWATHERRRERLVAFARRRLVHQLERRGASQRDLERARGVLDTRALTIGFARRFATYKRANLILSDVQRLKKILLDAQRPVQVIFAGKAHPRDHEAKEMLKAVVSFCQQEDARRHALFIEDYDLVIARYLVQGCDVWLNTPRRGLEASGTSGMKILPNGGLNLSILDGWWCEGYHSDAGWAIGKGEDYQDHGYQDYVESNALYELLEHDIVPLFFARGADGLPRSWIARMKHSMRTLTPVFSTNRMLWEYAEGYYSPAATYFERLSAEGYARAKALSGFKARVRKRWDEVQVEEVTPPDNLARRVGDAFEIKARIHLGTLSPDDVRVEIYHGPLDAQRQITGSRTVPMERLAAQGDGEYLYAGKIPCDRSGMVGYTVRIVPFHPDGKNLLDTGLVTWA